MYYLYVANACSPGEFYGYLSSSVKFHQLPELLANTCEMLWQQNTGGRVDLANVSTLKKQQRNVMVKMAGNAWLRCSTVEKGGASSGGQVSITLMDGGRRLVIPSSTPAVRMTQAIRLLSSLRFHLKDVLPVIGEKNAWPKSARDIFSPLALNRVFQVSDVDADGSVTLNDVQTGESLGLKLIELGVARSASKNSQPMIPVMTDLPIESQIFLERTGGLQLKDSGNCTGVSVEAVLKTVNQMVIRR